jgi:hypothetical protein
MLREGTMEINKEVPFGDWIQFRLRLTHEQRLDNLIELSKVYERHYLAWESVRKGGNPYFENGTGFEGYFVGACASPDEALEKMLTIGQKMLTNILHLHRFDGLFRSRLLKLLTDEQIDSRAMAEWSVELGAQLARLRSNLLYNRQANTFQTETYLAVGGLPQIEYVEDDHTINQHYIIACRKVRHPRIVVYPEVLNSTERDAWLIMQSVGKLGHPLVRQFMKVDRSMN